MENLKKLKSNPDNTVGKTAYILPLEGLEGRVVDVSVHPVVQYQVRYFNNGEPVFVWLFEDEVRFPLKFLPGGGRS